MPIPNDMQELTALFERIGAEEPESWAASQIEEGIPQLLRFMFLKQAWEYVIMDDDHSWIQSEIDRSDKNPNYPYSGLGIALKRCLSKGVDEADLTEMARCLQAEMISNLGYLIGDSAYAMDEEIKDVSWGLFQIDEEGNPYGPKISGINESVLELDPTGREMCPKKSF